MAEYPGQAERRFDYRPEIVEALLAHGMRVTPATPPATAREQLNDLYRWELRKLRARLLERAFPKPEYAARVIATRRRYFLLSIPLEAWLLPEGNARAEAPTAGGDAPGS